MISIIPPSKNCKNKCHTKKNFIYDNNNLVINYIAAQGAVTTLCSAAVHQADRPERNAQVSGSKQKMKFLP